MAAKAECQFKGQGFWGFNEGLTELQGLDAMKRLRPHLGPELRELVDRGGLVRSGWYPLTWFAELHGAARAEFGDAINAEIGRLGAKRDIGSVFRFVLSFAAPATVLRLSSRLFGMYFDGGKLECAELGPTQASLRFSGLVGCNAAAWDAVGAGTTSFVELSGGQGCTFTLTSGGGISSQASFLVSWRKRQ